MNVLSSVIAYVPVLAPYRTTLTRALVAFRRGRLHAST
jgi:hypothetical protein